MQYLLLIQICKKKVEKNYKHNLEINFLVYYKITKGLWQERRIKWRRFEMFTWEWGRSWWAGRGRGEGGRWQWCRARARTPAHTAATAAPPSPVICRYIDVGPGPEPQHTQQQQLHHLRPVIFWYIHEGVLWGISWLGATGQRFVDTYT